MSNEIKIGEDLLLIAIKLQEAAILVEDSTRLYESVMSQLGESKGIYEGKANSNMQLLNDTLTTNVSKLANYYAIGSNYVGFVFNEFIKNDEELVRQIALKFQNQN